MRAFIQGRVELFQPLAQRDAVTLEAHGEGESMAWADPHRLAQVLDNLIDNALRHTPAGGQIDVRCDAITHNQVRCAVRDNGPGIADEHVPHLFERFYRADPSRARSSGGSGLGLAIARALVAAHGGEISVSSRPGAGSTFSFTLPSI